MSPGYRVRVADASIAADLETFRCARPGFTYEREVEAFVQAQLCDWVFDPRAADADPRLLVVEGPLGDLVAVAAHERSELEFASDPPQTFVATKLEVADVSLEWQGGRLDDGTRVSDVLMSGVLTDVRSRVPARDARVWAIVHPDNERSLRLCQRYGLTQDLSPDSSGYRRLIN